MSEMLFILDFHGLGRPSRDVPPDEQPFWISVPFFESILDLVRGRQDVQITFDDSNDSDYEIALPALKARNMTAKFFVVTQRIDRASFLSKRQLQTLASEGMTIGSHGMHHRRWTGLKEGDLREELVEARNQLEQILGKGITDAACPFGIYDHRVLRELKNTGYKKVYTSDESPTFDDLWVQSRYSVLRTHDLPQIEKIVRRVPHGFRRTWCRIKLKLRQLC